MKNKKMNVLSNELKVMHLKTIVKKTIVNTEQEHRSQQLSTSSVS